MKILKRINTYLILSLCLFGNVLIKAQDVSKIVTRICDQNGIKAVTPSKDPNVTFHTECSGQSGLIYFDMYLITIDTDGTFTFIISPDGDMDYDFMSWKNPNLKNLGIADRASQNNPYKLVNPHFQTGLSLIASDYCEPINSIGDPEPGFVKYYDVKKGDQILIVIDMVEDTGNFGYQLNFGGTAKLGCSLEYEQCDTDNDGQVVYNLSSIREEIKQKIYPTNIGSVDFYDSYINAQIGIGGKLQDNYILPISRLSETIYARIENDKGSFFNSFPIKFLGYELPQYNPISIFPKCDFNNDGVEIFDLTEILPFVIQKNQNQTIDSRFYLSENRAIEGGNNYIQNPNHYFTKGTKVFLRLTNTNGCYVVIPFELKLIKFEDFNEQEILPISVCDEDLDGIAKINLLDELDKQDFNAFYTIKFYYNEKAAFENSEDYITSVQDYVFSANETLYVRLELGECAVIKRINLSIRKSPLLDFPEKIYGCQGETITLEAPLGYEYQWQDNEGKIIGNNSFLELTKSGKYNLILTTETCTYKKSIEIILGELPNNFEIQITQNSIQILHNNYNNFEYSLDQQKWQENNVFGILKPGLYNVFARPKRATLCKAPYSKIVVVGLTNFISPNGDGINDKWKINNFTNKRDIEIKIFDRYGKIILNNILSSYFEWNGKFNNNILPSDTYWFIIQNNSGLTTQGSILLKNK